jgi:K+-transporting ATPase ATPase C chain
MRAKIWLAHQLVARRAVLVLTVLLGLAYPLTMTAVAQIPGLRNQALGSIAHRLDGTPAGSTLIGSSSPTPMEIPSPVLPDPGRRPRATATTRPPARRATSAPRTWSTPCPAIPRTRPRGKQSLLTQWSKEVGTLEGVDGSRPFCTPAASAPCSGSSVAAGLTGPVTRAVSLDPACPAVSFLTTY